MKATRLTARCLVIADSPYARLVIADSPHACALASDNPHLQYRAAPPQHVAWLSMASHSARHTYLLRYPAKDGPITVALRQPDTRRRLFPDPGQRSMRNMKPSGGSKDSNVANPETTTRANDGRFGGEEDLLRWQMWVEHKMESGPRSKT